MSANFMPKTLVVTTQYMENYGDAENPYWKMKGGNTYIVKNIFPGMEQKIDSFFLPEVTKLVEYSNAGSREYVLGHSLVEEDAQFCEPWETPIEFNLFNQLKGWTAERLTVNNEYGHMRSDIEAKHERWTALPGGERTDYTVQYWDREGQDLFI